MQDKPVALVTGARAVARRIDGAPVKLVLIRLCLDRIETTESCHEV
jgi:hypothetical protein